MSLRLLIVQLFLTIAVANARNDAPPTSDKPWSPQGLSTYESELPHGRFSAEESGSYISINPRKVYGLAELMDIAERSNPETRMGARAPGRGLRLV
jgi:hypothetical protein